MSGRVLAAAVGAFVAGVVLSWVLPKLQYTPLPTALSQQESAHARRAGPRRVVCMSPAVTEITYALGQGDRVVGVSQHARYPREAREKPICGGFFNPNFERISALRPELIITQGEAEKLASFAGDHGIRIMSVELEDLQSVFVAVRRIGAALAAREEAEVLCARMRLDLAQVKVAVRGRPRPRVFLVVSREPGSLRNLSTVGPGSFLSDVLDVAGGENVFADVTRSYATVSKEALLVRQPEVIIELPGEGMIDPSEEARIAELWRAMPGLPAVRDGRVHAVGGTYAMIPGPRLVELARTLAAILHETGGR